MTVADCERLIDASRTDAGADAVRRTHVRLQRSRPRDARVRRPATSSAGRLHAHGDWAAPGPVRRDVNALWDLAPHPISILTLRAALPARRRRRHGQAILDDGREDVASLQLRYDDGAVGRRPPLVARAAKGALADADRRAGGSRCSTTWHRSTSYEIFDTACAQRQRRARVGPAAAEDRRSPPMPVHVPQIPAVRAAGGAARALPRVLPPGPDARERRHGRHERRRACSRPRTRRCESGGRAVALDRGRARWRDPVRRPPGAVRVDLQDELERALLDAAADGRATSSARRSRASSSEFAGVHRRGQVRRRQLGTAAIQLGARRRSASAPATR